MWNKAFLVQLLENSVSAGAASLAASLPLVTPPNWQNLEAAGIGGGLMALYTFAKGLGAIQKAQNTLNAPRVNPPQQ